MTTQSALSMIRRATEERGQGAEVYFANPDEKSAVRRLARKGLVTIRETTEKCAGYKVIYASLATVRRNDGSTYFVVSGTSSPA